MENWEAALDAAFEQLEGMKRNHGRYTLEEAAALISEHTGESADVMRNKFIAAVKHGNLLTYAPDSFVKKDSKTIRDFFEHVYWSDLNSWLEINEPRLNFRFPKPDATAAKGKVTGPKGDDWITKARIITNKIAFERYARGEREITQRNICDAVATELAKDSTTHGKRGPRVADSIRSIALKGWKFIPPAGTNGTNE